MKTSELMIHAIVLIIVSSTIMISCKDSNDSGSVSVGTIKAKLNSTGWEGAGAVAVVVTAQGIQTMTCVGTQLNGTVTSSLAVTFYSSQGSTLTKGAYEIRNQVPSGQIVYTDEESNVYIATSGSASITKINNNNYQGTFTGTLVNTNLTEEITLTDGQFNCDSTAFGF